MSSPGPDLRSVLGFVADLRDAPNVPQFAARAVAGLAGLIPADSVTFSELDVQGGRTLLNVTDAPWPEDAVADEVFWHCMRQHPLCIHIRRTGDGSAVTVSDLLSVREWHSLELYRVLFRPQSVEHVLELPLTTTPGRTRAFLFDRSSKDFARRDREVLNLLRPHLIASHRAASLRERHCMPAKGDGPVTGREWEILRLVALGMRNHEIAAALFLSPHTVRKHLENAFGKLGVHTRTAAVAAAFGAAGALPEGEPSG
jgi:DNA-binding CsgD family transcriptional regulator